MSDDPEVERQLLTVAPGFELQLVAKEPDVINPVQINFDPQGRLWVLSIPRYPQLLPGQDPEDFVSILENIDPKTGKAGKSTVFAGGLTVPTGMAPGDGGVYIGQADKLLHLGDPKNTGKATERRTLFAGFGTQDTHHTLNSFRWGPDGNLYFNQGVYIKSDVETPYGLRRYWGGGIWQLRPDRLKLDVYDRSIAGNNTWGHIFDPWGRSFVTSAWPSSINLVLPDSPLNNSGGGDVVPSLKMTHVADGRHCGATFITGDHFPPEYRGNLASGSFASQLVYRYEIKDAGPTFTGKQLAPLVTSKHRKFRPVDVQMGPDGCLYIADWYNEIIQHNQIDFRDPRRDHSHGRIWRLVAKDRPLLTPAKLVGVPAADVLEQLKSDNDAVRQQAKRALAERGSKEVAPALETWVKSLDAKDPNHARNLLEALWTSQSIDRVDPVLLAKVLASDEPRARAAACRVVGAWGDRLDDPASLLAPRADDADVRVRLEAVLAASKIPSAKALEAALKAVDHPVDPFLDFSLKKTANVLKPYWYPEFQKGQLTFAGRPKQLAFALAAIKANDALPQLAKLLANKQIPDASQAAVYSQLAGLGDPKLQKLAWEYFLSCPRPADRVAVLSALETAARERGVTPDIKLDKLTELLEQNGNGDDPTAAAIMRLAAAWKLESARKVFEEIARTDRKEVGRVAVDALVTLGKSADALEKLAGENDPLIRTRALAGLATLDAKRAAPIAADLLKRPLQADDDPAPLFEAFLGRSQGAAILAAAFEKERPSVDAAKIGLRMLHSAGVPEGPLHKVLQSVADVAASRKLTPDDLKRLLAEVPKGDPVRGEAIFRRASMGCLQCHAIGGAGGRVGPDLSGIGASSQVDYLLDSILTPDKVIREGYNTAHVTTIDGKSISGVILRESPADLVLRTATNDEITLPKKSIDERAGGGSLMPQGIANLVTDAELVDLVRFLSEVGKPGPFAVSHVPVARKWRLAPSATSEVSQWPALFAKVSGELPVGELKGPIATVATQFEVATAGIVSMVVNDESGLTMELDGKELTAKQLLRTELAAGVHTLRIRVDLSLRKSPTLSCAIGPDTRAAVQFVGR